MVFTTDSFFAKGYTHEVCQDYAIDGMINGIHYAVVSDGCSASADVDVGARILAHCFKKSLDCLTTDKYMLEDMISYIKSEANYIRNTMGLPITCLDATIQGIFIKDDKLHILSLGDGYTIIRGTGIIMETAQFDSGAPYYISYMMSPDRNRGYMTQFNQNIDVVRGAFNGYEYNPPTVVMPTEYLEKQMYYNVHDVNELFNTLHSDVITVTVTSDGLHSFGDVGICDTIEGFTSYKNFSHGYMSRRAKKYLSELKELGFDHYDDLGIASISIRR